MNNHAIRTARLTDRQIVDLIITVREGLGVAGATIAFGAGAVENISSSSADAELEKYKENRHAIQSFELPLERINVIIRFRRGICKNTEQPDRERQTSPYFDEIFIVSKNTNQTTSPDDIIKCLDVMEGVRYDVPGTFEGQGADIVDALRVEMSTLNETYRNMLKDGADERHKLLKGLDEQRLSVEEDRRTASKKSEQEAEQRQREFQNSVKREEDSLSQRQHGLDTREQELDNREHMHVRRDLRERILEEVRGRSMAPVVSRSAGRMRWTVFFMTLFAGIGLTGFGLWTFYLLVGAEFTAGSYWVLVVRAAILSAGGIGLFLYAIQWLRSIYLDDVRTTRYYDNYRDDIDRASFAIETIMEVGSEKEGVAAPEVWVEGVCRNLFRSDVGDKAEGGRQADALIELLKSISSASVGLDGAEVRLDRRGSRRLAKKMGADDG